MTDMRHIPQEELALHAMQALSIEEAAAVRLHLSECGECRDHLAEVSGDLALVAMGVDQHPVPPGARQRFIARVAASALKEPPGTSSRVVSISQRKTGPGNSAWIAWVAVAALLVLSAVLGIRIYFLNQQLEMDASLIQARTLENRRAREVLDVLTTPRAQHVLLTAGKTPPAPSARAVYLASRGALVLQASNMQPLPENKTYELWVIPTAGAPVPAGLFRPDAAGSASVVLPSIPLGVPAKAFGITIEDAGGSNTPTAPIILSGAAPVAGE
jgi:Anti-sigma-K factor rskA